MAWSWCELLEGVFGRSWYGVGQFFSSFCAIIITLLSIESIGGDYYAMTSLLRHNFKLYTKVYIASSFKNSGNATTRLSNTVMYYYMEPCCCSSHSLFWAMFLSSNGVYWFRKSFLNFNKLFGALLYTFNLSIYLAAVPLISATIH